MSGARHDAVLIEATKGTHELELDRADGVIGARGNQKRKQIFTMSHSSSLGGRVSMPPVRYSGIRPRGFLKNTFKQIKKKDKAGL